MAITTFSRLLPSLPTITSALVIVALAGILLYLNPRSWTNRVFAFLVFARGGSNLVAPSLVEPAYQLAFMRLDFVLAAALVSVSTYFLFLYPRPVGWIGRSKWGWAPFGAAGLLLAGIALARFDLLGIPEFGPNGNIRFRLETVTPLLAVYGANSVIWMTMCLILALTWARSPPSTRTPIPLLILLGFLLNNLPSYTRTTWLDWNGGTYASFGARIGVFVVEMAFVLALATVAVIAFVAMRGDEARSRRHARITLVAVGFVAIARLAILAYPVPVGPFTLASITGALAILSFPVLVLYALARHQLFDVDLKLKKGLGFLLGKRAANRILPNVDDSPDYIAMRKLEVYRLALADADARGATPETEQRVLSELRKSLGISGDVHRTMVLMLQADARRRKGELTQATRAKYRIERELGQGGFGRVFLATDTALDRKVVLKQPAGLFAQDENARQMFVKEARLAARIQHPNVVTTYHILEEEEPPMLVMEYVEGGSVEDVLKARGKLSPDETLRLARDLLAGLARVHEEGIVHRDVKPANVLLDKRGNAKITDFGIAHAASATQAMLTVAGTGYQPGSLAYMSPEQARGDPLDARSDLYSLAVLLHEAAGGRHYLGELSAGDFRLRARIQTESPDLAAVPLALRGALARALAKDAAARFASAAEMAAALDAAAAGSASRAAGASAAAPGA